jgi:uncharacterized protein YkwD
MTCGSRSCLTVSTPTKCSNWLTKLVSRLVAKDMAARQYYAHKNPDGHYYYDLFPDQGINVDYSCENLDVVFVPDITQFIDQWMASTHGHRECLTKPDLTQAGYAVTNMMFVEYGGQQVPAYLVVAIHSTALK